MTLRAAGNTIYGFSYNFWGTFSCTFRLCFLGNAATSASPISCHLELFCAFFAIYFVVQYSVITSLINTSFIEGETAQKSADILMIIKSLARQNEEAVFNVCIEKPVHQAKQCTRQLIDMHVLCRTIVGQLWRVDSYSCCCFTSHILSLNSG